MLEVASVVRESMKPSHKNLFARRLNLLLDKRGFAPKGEGRQSKLATLIGVSPKGARRWLEGEGLPSPEKLNVLVEKLACNYEWLARGRGEPWEMVEVAPMAANIEWHEIMKFAERARDLTLRGQKGDELKASLVIRDTSMESIIPERKSLHVGDIVTVLFDPTIEHHEGSIVLARPWPNKDDAIIRQYHTGHGKPYLECFNPRWKDPVMELPMNGISLLGVVINVLRPLI